MPAIVVIADGRLSYNEAARIRTLLFRSHSLFSFGWGASLVAAAAHRCGLTNVCVDHTMKDDAIEPALHAVMSGRGHKVECVIAIRNTELGSLAIALGKVSGLIPVSLDDVVIGIHSVVASEDYSSRLLVPF